QSISGWGDLVPGRLARELAMGLKSCQSVFVLQAQAISLAREAALQLQNAVFMQERLFTTIPHAHLYYLADIDREAWNITRLIDPQLLDFVIRLGGPPILNAASEYLDFASRPGPKTFGAIPLNPPKSPPKKPWKDMTEQEMYAHFDSIPTRPAMELISKARTASIPLLLSGGVLPGAAPVVEDPSTSEADFYAGDEDFEVPAPVTTHVATPSSSGEDESSSPSPAKGLVLSQASDTSATHTSSSSSGSESDGVSSGDESGSSSDKSNATTKTPTSRVVAPAGTDSSDSSSGEDERESGSEASGEDSSTSDERSTQP
ncbi:hypothetical protein BDN70DRAFT_939571, partial [Pholiota conissans]